jgi:hypothetical protein
MVRMAEPEVARVSKALWASADPTRAHRPRSVSSSEPRDRQSAEFEPHEASRIHTSINSLLFVTENGHFHQFIILTIILPFLHYADTRWGRF